VSLIKVEVEIDTNLDIDSHLIQHDCHGTLRFDLDFDVLLVQNLLEIVQHLEHLDIV
jgi:hypothetical protein